MRKAIEDKGRKADLGKLRYDLLSSYALEQLVKVLTYGSVKYEDRNWEKGIAWGRVFGALMRHAWAFWGGEEIDPESGLPHMDHVQACSHFLSHYGKYNRVDDDRPKKEKTWTSAEH